MTPLTNTTNTMHAANAAKRRGSKPIRRIALGLGVILLLLAGLALVGAGYEASAARADAQTYPAPGELVAVGGHRLHIHCVGTGSPTVVLDAGLGGTSLDWNLVQTQIGQTTRVCAYDRAGMGWVISPARGEQGEPSIWHGGDTANFHADMVILPGKRLGIIVLTNVNGNLARMTNAQGILAQGVERLLLGQQPPAPSTFWQHYLVFDATLLLCTVLVLVSVLRLLRRRRQPLKRDPMSLVIGIALPLLWEIGLPIGMLLGFPTLVQASWPLILLYFPDLGYWLLIICCLLLATAALRLILASARWRGTDMKAPALAAPSVNLGR